MVEVKKKTKKKEKQEYAVSIHDVFLSSNIQKILEIHMKFITTTLPIPSTHLSPLNFHFNYFSSALCFSFFLKNPKKY